MKWTLKKSQKLCASLVASGLLRKPWPQGAMVEKAEGLERRFQKKITKTEGCWGFKSTVYANGYSCFYIERNGPAHRASFVLHGKTVPKGMLVCHSCDNRRCVKPEHLWLGTPKQNTQDMLKKGRGFWVCGEEKNNSKLRRKQVLEIFNSPRGITHISLSEKYKVAETTIRNIRNGKKWKSVTQESV